MVTTRSSEAVETDSTGAGAKHNIDRENGSSSPNPKRTKKPSAPAERQLTLEEVIEGRSESADDANDKGVDAHEDSEPIPVERVSKNADEKSDDQPVEKSPANGAQAAKSDKGQDPDMPSSVLEKGIIYFFIRGRVDTEDAGDLKDVARSYMILHPIALDEPIGNDGPLPDTGNSRLLAIPKKVLPRSGRDRFLAFVERAGASARELRDGFLPGNTYETKTVGTRHTPAAAPVGEGVYLINSTGRESHLAYILTLPEEPGKFQAQLGIGERGSFIISTKNPEFPGPAQFRLPDPPEFPKEVTEEFNSLRWLPTQPKHLDFPNAQILLVGEKSGLDKATEPQKEDVEEGKEEPLDVLEELEHEDTKRMKHLDENDSAAVFKDLRAFSEGYARRGGLQT